MVKFLWKIESIVEKNSGNSVVKKFLKKGGIFFESVKSPASGMENVRLLDSPDLKNLPDFWTGHDVQ